MVMLGMVVAARPTYMMSWMMLIEAFLELAFLMLVRWVMYQDSLMGLASLRL
jgi:hypothetical protein